MDCSSIVGRGRGFCCVSDDSFFFRFFGRERFLFQFSFCSKVRGCILFSTTRVSASTSISSFITSSTSFSTNFRYSSYVYAQKKHFPLSVISHRMIFHDFCKVSSKTFMVKVFKMVAEVRKQFKLKATTCEITHWKIWKI